MGFSERIYQQAIEGTDFNPGLPPSLALLVVAQAKHETGNFSSDIFKNQNNAFGYGYVPGSVYQLAQPGTVSPGQGQTAKYRSVEDSTREIIDWIYRRVKENIFPVNLATVITPLLYAELLKKASYYTDTVSHYADGLRRWLNETILSEGLTQTGTILLMGILFYLVYRNYLKKSL